MPKGVFGDSPYKFAINMYSGICEFMMRFVGRIPENIEYFDKFTNRLHMNMKHIIIMGFKKIGKTTFAKGLAKDFNLAFIDIDDMIEEEHTRITGEELSFREIANKYGYDTYFRRLEHKMLKKALNEFKSVGVISLGGGTALREENQALLKDHICVNVMGSKNAVYERIINKGRPIFFPDGMGDREAFDYLWDIRQKVYKNLADIEVNFDGTIEEAVGEFKEKAGISLILVDKIITKSKFIPNYSKSIQN